jgi:hypothetical protein
VTAAADDCRAIQPAEYTGERRVRLCAQALTVERERQCVSIHPIFYERDRVLAQQLRGQ